MKKLKKVKNKILKMSITSKIVCSVLILALVVGAVAYGVSSMEAKGENPEDDPTRVEIRQDTEEAIGSINQVPAKN